MCSTLFALTKENEGVWGLRASVRLGVFACRGGLRA